MRGDIHARHRRLARHEVACDEGPQRNRAVARNPESCRKEHDWHLRERVLQVAIAKLVHERDGMCVMCGDPGREIDHIVPVHLGGDDSVGNLRLLCSPYHAKVTAEQQSAGSMMQFNPFASYMDPRKQEAVFYVECAPRVLSVQENKSRKQNAGALRLMSFRETLRKLFSEAVFLKKFWVILVTVILQVKKKQRLKEIIDQEKMKEMKNSPSINQASKKMAKRGVDKMMEWEKKRQAKLEKLKQEKIEREKSHVILPKASKKSEKILLEIPLQRDQCCHSAGSLEFGPNGNLFISVGDNTNPFDSDGFSPSDESKNLSGSPVYIMNLL